MGTHGKPSFLGVRTHILGVQNLHFSWFWGPRVYIIELYTIIHLLVESVIIRNQHEL